MGCAELLTRGRAVEAVAHFTGNITGEVRLTQPADSLFAETMVHLRLQHTGDLMPSFNARLFLSGHHHH